MLLNFVESVESKRIFHRCLFFWLKQNCKECKFGIIYGLFHIICRGSMPWLNREYELMSIVSVLPKNHFHVKFEVNAFKYNWVEELKYCWCGSRLSVVGSEYVNLSYHFIKNIAMHMYIEIKPRRTFELAELLLWWNHQMFKNLNGRLNGDDIIEIK